LLNITLIAVSISSVNNVIFRLFSHNLLSVIPIIYKKIFSFPKSFSGKNI